jgi:Fur family peroxide stress response transcriptional regulator
MALAAHDKEALDEALAQHGLRSTKQREHVFGVLLTKRDHPSADEVYTRSKSGMPGISLATVYNCLETLVACGLVKQVNHERESTRYCPNLAHHAHFHDKSTGRVMDIDLPPTVLDELRRILPAGYDAENIEISFHGSTAAKQPRKSA